MLWHKPQVNERNQSAKPSAYTAYHAYCANALAQKLATPLIVAAPYKIGLMPDWQYDAIVYALCRKTCAYLAYESGSEDVMERR